MSRALVLVLIAGCVSYDRDRGMGGLSMHLGAGRTSDGSPDRAQGTPTVKGAHLIAMYRLYPTFALGLGLDSTSLTDETADGEELAYNSYGGAFTARLDTGRFAVLTTAAFYIGERSIDGIRRKLPTSGPGVGASALVRVGTRSFAVEVGPFIRYFYLRGREDEDETMDYDERELRLSNLAFGISIGVMLGGPPPSGIDDDF